MYYQQFHLAKDDFSLGPLISVLFNFFQNIQCSRDQNGHSIRYCVS